MNKKETLKVIKAELEGKLLEGASPGFGDTDPTLFIVG